MGRRVQFAAGSLRKLDRWGRLCSLIKDGMLVPIISNSIVNDRVFDIAPERGLGISRDMKEECVDRECEEYSLRIDQHLASQWALMVEYPLAEEPLHLSRVAQYCQVEEDSSLAKRKYLLFLKLYLLDLAADDTEAATAAQLQLEPFLDSELDNLREQDQLLAQSDQQSFSEIVFQLGYPRRESQQQDPLYLLAKLPLPVYVTTSHHDFLERALAAAGKHPRMLVCDWFGNSTPLEHRIEWFGDPPDAGEDVNSHPTDVNPIVCHLYGLEIYPETIVISEDDYMQFLVKVSEDRNNIPLKLREALGNPRAAMLLLGYPLRGWDFRVLFRGLIQPYIDARAKDGSHLAVQLNPPYQRHEEREVSMPDELQKAQKYLEGYLDSSNFHVVWNTALRFLQALWMKWDKMRV